MAISDSIRMHHDGILEGWLAFATRARSAAGLDREEILGAMPGYLAVLEDPAVNLGESDGSRRKQVEAHLAIRIRQGFLLDEIVREYEALRSVIEAIVRATAPDGAAADLALLRAEVDWVVASTSELFHDHMAEDEQVEKGYFRRLERLAQGILERGASRFDEHVIALLELVAEALSADGTALVLQDPRTEAPTTTHFVRSPRASSFAPDAERSRLARRDSGTIKAGSGGLDAVLAGCAVRSRVEVHLPSRHALCGILHAWSLEHGAFGHREIRRLESLGDRISLHLDNVKLVSELAEKVDALRAERQLREQFVSSVAHDLRGPLSAAKMGTQSLLRSLERPDRHLDLVSRIARNIDRAEGMIRDLLDVSRIHAGEPLPITLAECEASSLARELVDELNALYGERFVLRAPGIVPGYWSAQELRRALWNLATNAAKYGSADRPITVTVTSRGSAVSISVHNHGVPIPRTELRKIFEPFFRLQRGKTGPQGWGLGLTLVLGCAAAHGGRVEVHSDAASGTTFTLELPLDVRANPSGEGAITDRVSAS